MPKKLTELDSESKAFLLSKTPYILPDNPSSKGFSAFQIKSAMYGGYVVLYEWLKRMGSETQNNLDYLNNSLETVKNEVGGAGMLFVPAMQSEEPDESKVKVWLETELQEGDVEEMSFSKEVKSTVTVTDEDGNSFEVEQENGGEALSFGEEAETLTFGE